MLAARDPANLVWRMIRAYDHHRLAEAYDVVGERTAAASGSGSRAPCSRRSPSRSSTTRRCASPPPGRASARDAIGSKLGERRAGLDAMQQAIEMLARGAEEMPKGELPYRAAQAREELAMTLDPADPTERAEGRVATDAAIQWTKGVLDKGHDPFTAAMLARLEALRARFSGG